MAKGAKELPVKHGFRRIRSMKTSWTSNTLDGIIDATKGFLSYSILPNVTGACPQEEVWRHPANMTIALRQYVSNVLLQRTKRLIEYTELVILSIQFEPYKGTCTIIADHTDRFALVMQKFEITVSFVPIN